MPAHRGRNGGTCREPYAKADQSGMVAGVRVEALLIALLPRPENFRHLSEKRTAQLGSFRFKLLLKLPHFDLQAVVRLLNAIDLLVVFDRVDCLDAGAAKFARCAIGLFAIDRTPFSIGGSRRA